MIQKVHLLTIILSFVPKTTILLISYDSNKQAEIKGLFFLNLSVSGKRENFPIFNISLNKLLNHFRKPQMPNTRSS